LALNGFLEKKKPTENVGFFCCEDFQTDFNLRILLKNGSSKYQVMKEKFHEGRENHGTKII
jgi:hypothetical protein